MALVAIEFMRTHLATWSTRQGTPKDAELILRYLEYSQAWEYAFNNGWPRTLECAQDWDAYNRDLKLRCRNGGPFIGSRGI